MAESLLQLVAFLVLFLEAVLKIPQPKIRHDHLKDADPKAEIHAVAIMETETMIPEKDINSDAVIKDIREKMHRKILKNRLVSDLG